MGFVLFSTQCVVNLLYLYSVPTKGSKFSDVILLIVNSLSFPKKSVF